MKSALVEGVRRGRIEDLRPILDEMIAKRTWVTPAVYEQVLELAHEVRQVGKRGRSREV